MAGDFTHTPNFGSEILAPVSGTAAKPLGFFGGSNCYWILERNMKVSRDGIPSHHGFLKTNGIGMILDVLGGTWILGKPYKVVPPQ